MAMAGFTTSYNVHDQAKSYYNPARSSIYTRYAPSDWFSSNNNNFNLSHVHRSQAERIRADSWQLVQNTNSLARNRQTDSTLRLGQRAADIGFWRSELNNEIGAMESEIRDLSEHKRVLEKAFADTRGPMQVASECLLHRENRLGIDMVHDGVERNLIKEATVIKQSQDRMRDVLQATNVQLRLNRQAQHQMEKDARDKQSAYALDDRMHQMRNSSSGIGYHPGVETMDNTVSFPTTWAKFSQQNIGRSQGERSASERLRANIKGTLQSCANDMWSQYNNVNVAFNSRISEVTDAKNKLQQHRQSVMDNIFQQERNNDLLRKAIQEKEAPLKVAHTRLQARMMRPNVEACDDNPNYGLKEEVSELKASIGHLKSQLQVSEKALAQLNKTKATLDFDIGVKSNSLNIDNGSCMGIRKGFPSMQRVGPAMTDKRGW